MSQSDINLKDPKYYQNRELSWLDFNERVIAEAEDDTNPLLEQLRFISIGSSNLDEFVRVRVAGLIDQTKLGVMDTDSKKQWTPSKQLEEIAIRNTKNVAYQYDIYHQKVKELENIGVYISDISELNPSNDSQVIDYFEKNVMPGITPYGVDAYRPFPHLNDGLIHIFVKLERDGEDFVAIVPVPPLLDRVQLLEVDGVEKTFFTEDIIRYNLDSMFKGFDIKYSFFFRITRNADLELQEEGAEDLLSVIEDYIERRKNGMAVRLEIDTRHADERFTTDVAFLMGELDVLERDVYSINGPLDLTFLMELVDKLEDSHPDLTFKPFIPAYPPVLVRQSVADVVDRQDLFLHHPYDSFKPIIEMIKEAVDDPNTIAIKMTLYRVSKDSPLVAALKKAARNNIQVTVLVELKARFDEANNVHWAKELEEAGAHILYGMKELKTHSKATLVVKKDNKGGFRRYAHLGTGNYNEKTAKQYTDMGIITSNPALTEDVANFFNYLSGYSEQPTYNHLHVSPFEIRDTFIEKIELEIKSHQEHGHGHIIAKMNSLTDKVIILKLFEANQAGVKIDLIVRGICCLIPGVPGVSENITVRSIVGRFLEHSRIYYFYQNGEEKLYLSSADMMTRNMIKRVELAFPVMDKNWSRHIINLLHGYLKDNTKAWELESDGQYHKQTPAEGEEPMSIQSKLLKQATALGERRKVKERKNWFGRLSEKLLKNH